jgi:hypothetical protein
MSKVFAALRGAMGVLALVAVVATFAASAAKAPINPFNFFGYFTIQTNIGLALVLIVLAVEGFTGRTPSPLLRLTSASFFAYMLVVGIVYNTLLIGMAGGVLLPWANTVLHVVLPIYALIDLVLFGDRDPLPWKRFAFVLIYPLVWTVVVLIRGATDGWVPYPFLGPSQGYGVVALFCVAIAIAFAAAGALAWWLSRVHILKPVDVRSAA